MNFDEFLQKAWAEHGDDTQAVADRLPEAWAFLTEERQLPSLAALVVHVLGEHLGRWQDGVDSISSLRKHALLTEGSAADKALHRSLSVLYRCAGQADEAEASLLLGSSGLGGSGGEFPEASDRIRVLAIAASALAGQDRSVEATQLFEEALDLASYGPSRGDPAAQALAITGNNLACALEEKAGRSEEETELMKLAARAGRTYWEVAGDWRNVERAEYRLAMTYIRADEPELALGHAEACLAICEEHGRDPIEMFFAYEARAYAAYAAEQDEVARASRASAADLLEQIDGGMKDYCSSTLERLDRTLAYADEA